MYNFLGENGYLDFLGVDSEQYGVCHSDELYLMWNPYWFENYSLNDVCMRFLNLDFCVCFHFQEDIAMGSKMVKYWVDFAVTGLYNSKNKS